MTVRPTFVYRAHPTLPYQVSECGDSILTSTGEDVTPPIPNGNGYMYLYGPHGTKGIHILVCETYHENPENKPLVNHIDGNKRNNHKDNVEWATYSENLDHAYAAGLRTDNTPVLVKDLRTNKITRYHSLQRVASYFNVNGEKVHRWLNSKNRYPFENWYDMSYKEKGFKGLTKADFGTIPNGAPRQVVVVDKDANITLYESLGAAQIGTGLGRGVIYGHVSERTPRVPKTDKGYMCYYLDQYPGKLPDDVKTVLMDVSRKVLPTRESEPVRVTHMVTGESKVYDDIGEFAAIMKHTKSAIQKFVPSGRWANYRLEYVNRVK